MKYTNEPFHDLKRSTSGTTTVAGTKNDNDVTDAA